MALKAMYHQNNNRRFYSVCSNMLGTTSSRDQAIETYRSLLKKKKDLTRKNRALQTKIAQFARKHKVDLCGNIELSETTAEADAKLYNDLLDQLKDITYDKIKEMKHFNESLTDYNQKTESVESQIILVEDQLGTAQNRICSEARDSQTNKKIPQELIYKSGQQLAEREKDKKKLLLEKLRYSKRLQDAEEAYQENCTYSSKNIQFSQQLAMEKSACQAEIERSVDRNVFTRRNLVENMVLTSHIRLRKHFLCNGMDKMAILFEQLNRNLLRLKKNFNEEKKTENERKAEFCILESKAGILRNIPMLRDLKLTEEMLHIQKRRNEMIQKKLGHWWEG